MRKEERGKRSSSDVIKPKRGEMIKELGTRRLPPRQFATFL